MNIENIKELINFLKILPDENFNHGTWAQDDEYNKSEIPGRGICGTSACIAGWTTLLSNPEEWHTFVVDGVNYMSISDIGKYSKNIERISTDAKNWLGLTKEQA